MNTQDEMTITQQVILTIVILAFIGAWVLAYFLNSFAPVGISGVLGVVSVAVAGALEDN